MTLTYAQFVGKVQRLISDPDGTVYSDELLHDAVCAAHDAVLPWVPNYNDVVLTAGSDGDLFILPTDVYDLQAVQVVETMLFIPRATLASGTTRGYTLAENDWIESPRGYLSLSKALSEGATLSLHYLASWPKPPLPGSTTFVIRVPEYAHQGMIYYAASIVLTPPIVDTATLNPFKSRVDSGNPEHNPMRDVSNWFRQLWLQEMKNMPPYQKARA